MPHIKGLISWDDYSNELRTDVPHL